MAPPPPNPAPSPAAQAAAGALDRLFRASYRYNPARQTLDIPADRFPLSLDNAKLLREKKDELSKKALSDRATREALEGPDIARYWYLSSTDLTARDRGLFWRLDRGGLNAAQACRAIDQIEIDEVTRYNGGSVLPVPFQQKRAGILVHGLYFFLTSWEGGPTEWGVASACQQSALAAADPNGHLFPPLNPKGSKGSAREQERFDKARLFHLDSADLEREMEAAREIVLKSVDEDEKIGAARRYSYISFVLASRRIETPSEMRVEACLRQNPGVEKRVCEFQNELISAEETPLPFDNYDLYDRRTNLLKDFYRRYAGLTPEQRVQSSVFLEDGLLTELIGSGEFGSPPPPASVEAVLGEAGRENGFHLPPPLTLDLDDILRRTTAVEVRAEKLPPSIRSAAMQIPMGGGNAWDYLQAHLRSVIFARRLADRPDIGEPAGSAIRLLRTAVINLDHLPRRNPDLIAPILVAWLVHEASHVDYDHNLVPGNPPLAKAMLLNERNAHLREAIVYRQMYVGIKKNPNPPPQVKMILLDFYAAVYAKAKLTALAANIPLGYPPDDFTVRTNLVVSANDPNLGTYPTSFIKDWLWAKGTTEEAFTATLRKELD